MTRYEHAEEITNGRGHHQKQNSSETRESWHAFDDVTVDTRSLERFGCASVDPTPSVGGVYRAANRRLSGRRKLRFVLKFSFFFSPATSKPFFFLLSQLAPGVFLTRQRASTKRRGRLDVRTRRRGDRQLERDDENSDGAFSCFAPRGFPWR